MSGALMLVEVSTAEEYVSVSILRQTSDGPKYITEGLPPLTGGLAGSSTPSKR